MEYIHPSGLLTSKQHSLRSETAFGIGKKRMEYLIFHQYDGTWVLYGKYLLCHSNRVYKFVELKDTFCQVEKKHLHSTEGT